MLHRWLQLTTAFLAILLIPTEGICQQSLFNVPAGLLTPSGKVFAQEQLTLSQHEGESNTSLAYGLGPWLEVGMNVLHVPLYHPTEPPSTGLYASSILAHASVALKPTSWATVFVGGAAGVGEMQTEHSGLVTLGWGLTRWEAPRNWGSYVVGVYLGSGSAVGSGLPIGGLLGAEIPLVPEKLSFLADWVIGNNNISVAVVGLVAFLGPRVQVSVGAQLPSPGTENPFGGVLELTYVPIAESRGRH